MNGSAEIICVGTELLLGDILNRNAQFLARQLADLGIPHYYQTVVGDNPMRIKQAVAIACERARLLIFTGGLGPTPDDLTHQTLADFFDLPLVEHRSILEDIQVKFAQRGRTMPETNRKQALLPKGAEVLPNAIGSAPGVIWQPRPGLTVMTFPGVPSEMQAMWQTTAVPYLQGHQWGQGVFVSRTLRFWGISESALAAKVMPWLGQGNPTVAPYASWGEVKLRITARGNSLVNAAEVIAPVEAELRRIGGLDCYGSDDDSLASVVGAQLRSQGQTLAVAESCTGGGLGELLTAIAGSSDYFWGGIIAYANSVKVSLLNVDPDRLAQDGAVSAVVAEQMACGVKQQLGSDWSLSITGIAGPGGGSEEKPVGLVYIGLASPDGQVRSHRYQFGSSRGRDWIRHVSRCYALDQLRRALVEG